VNVWIALTYERHVHHLAARNWFEALPQDARLCFCRFTQIGFLRLLTTETVMGRNEVMSQGQAWETYDRWMEDGRVIFLDEPPSLEASFRSISQARRTAPKDWADSYLVAFALISGLKLVTFDQALHGRSGELVILKK
jgi:toxin-antitoxin system PIN domain toxin